VELRSEGAPGSDQPDDEPRSGLSSFSGIDENSRCSLRGAVERVHRDLVGSSAYEPVRRKEACIHQLLQSVGCPQGSQESKARSSVRNRALGVQKGNIPAPSTRAYKEYAHRFLTVPMDEFRTSCIHHELGCTLRRVVTGKCRLGSDDIENYGELMEQKIERRAKVRGLHALVSTSSCKQRMEFVNRGFNAAISIRRCAVLKTRSAELTRTKSLGQSFRLEMCKKKLKPIAGGWSKKTGRRLHVGV